MVRSPSGGAGEFHLTINLKTITMDENEILELLTVTKSVLSAINADTELHRIQATNARLVFNAYKEQLFTDEQALMLVCASMKSPK